MLFPDRNVPRFKEFKLDSCVYGRCVLHFIKALLRSILPGTFKTKDLQAVINWRKCITEQLQKLYSNWK